MTAMVKKSTFIQINFKFFFFSLNIQFNLLIILILLYNNQAYDFHYHNYTEMTRFLHNIASHYPTKAALYEIGKTEGGI